ncbi:MAG: TIGR02186 family protein [Pseudomonadota bacterium]
MIRLAILLLALALPARAEEVVAALSQDRVSISTSFDGQEILIFGAIKRDAPAPDGAALGVIIAVSGPGAPVTVRRKDRRFGIWVNVESVDVNRAPSFYAVASNGPLSDRLTETEDQRHRISIPRAIRAVGAATMSAQSSDFLEALIRVREAAGIYKVAEDAVHLRDDTLFSAEIALPSDLTEGDYQTRIFLTRDGAVVDSFSTSIFVRKVGLERLIYNLAHDQPLIYGLLSLAIAIAAGWGASAIFRLARN